MKTMTVPDFSTPTIGRKRYKQFRGVDYSTDETQIDDGRSPRAVNVIADEGGAPERRWGWRTVLNLGGNRPVAGIFLYEATTETGRARLGMTVARTLRRNTKITSTTRTTVRLHRSGRCRSRAPTPAGRGAHRHGRPRAR